MAGRGILTVLLGAGTWLGLVLMRLRAVPERLWIARDDAVITLSHARNAAEFGSIGVSPGDRTEGFSSPLHFGIGYLFELVSEPGYRTLSLWILIGASAITGAAVASALRSLAHKSGADSLLTDGCVVLLTAATAAWVVTSWTTVGWIGSGMENPVVIAAGMIAIALAVASSGDRWRQIALVLALAMFAIGRVEFAAFAVPFVLAAAWSFASSVAKTTDFGGPQRLRSAAETAGAALALIGLVHGARRLYFGEWLPNTAVVQGRAEGLARPLAIALIAGALVCAVLVTAVRSLTMSDLGRPKLVRQLSILGVAFLAAAVLMSVTKQTAGNAIVVGGLPPILPLFLVIAALFLLDSRLHKQPHFVDAVLLSASAIPLAQFVVMGQARLDPFRVTSIAVPFLALWVSSLVLRVGIHLANAERLPSWLAGSRRVGAATLIGVAILVAWASVATIDESRRLNWEVSGAPEVVRIVQEYRTDRLGDGLVILANPDLGKVSYEKNAIMVDLGFLGDPLLTRLSASRWDLLGPYLQFVAAPDVVQLHGSWSCAYTSWLTSEPFAATYVPSDPTVLDGVDESADCAFDRRRVNWLRVGPEADAEHNLVGELIASEDPALVVRRELLRCAVPDEDAFRCQGVRRALQRASVELRRSGTYDDAVAEMQASPSASFDTPMLLRGSGWADDAHDALMALVGG